MMGWYGGPGWSGGWGSWLGMGLMMLVFWGALAAGAVALFRAAGRDRQPATQPLAQSTPGDPRQLLDEQLARGTLSIEEYQRRRDLLEGK